MANVLEGRTEDLQGIPQDGIIVTGVDPLDVETVQFLEEPQKIPRVGSIGPTNLEWGIPGKQDPFLLAVKADGIIGMSLDMEHPAVPVPHLDDLTFHEKAIDVGTGGEREDLGMEPLDDLPETSRVIEMIVGENHPLDAFLANPGMNLFDFPDHETVDSDIDQGVSVFEPVPIAQDQMRIA